MNNINDLLCTVLAFFALLIAVVITANGDFEEEQRKAEEYCYNVENGVWPDFEGSYKKECKKVLDERKANL
jgi:hypothetical protein